MYRKHYGKDGDPVLVWQAATRDMNPSVPQSFVDAHLADDPARGQAEYMAQFRSDLESFVVREAVEACVSAGVRERPPQPFVSYSGFADPSGGSADSFALCIGHKDHGRQIVVVDALREIKAPFSPENAVYEFARLLKSYNVSRIEGDHYAGSWPVEQFRKFGILYEPAARPKSELYVDLLPLINSRRIELLDDARLVNQLCALERRIARSGKDAINHPDRGHDDLINAAALALVNAAANGTGIVFTNEMVERLESAGALDRLGSPGSLAAGGAYAGGYDTPRDRDIWNNFCSKRSSTYHH